MFKLLTNLNTTLRVFFLGALTALLIVGCGGSGAGKVGVGGGGGNPTPVPSTDPTLSVAKVVLSTTLAAVKSDDSDQADIVATLLDSGNSIVVGAKASFTSSSGVLVVANPVSDASGKVTGKFSSGTSDASNRTATITVSSNAVSSLIPVRVAGSTISLALVGTTTLPSDASKTADLTVTAKDGGGSPVGNSPVTISSVGTPVGGLTFSTDGGKTFTPTATGNTDSNGNFAVKVGGNIAGAANASVSALGVVRTQSFTVTQATTSANFAVSSVNGAPLPTNRVVPLSIGASLSVSVAASASANAVFASSLGTWDGTASSVVTKPITGGVASATLVSTKAGVANVQVYDPAVTGRTESFALAITAPSSAAANITIQASPNVVQKSTGGTTGTSSLVATVTDNNGNPVGGAQVSFEIIKSTGGGETINPVVQLSASVPSGDVGLGQARITFTSGSLPSAQGGVEIRAKVVGTSVTTVDPKTPGPADALLTIGGTPGSIAFGQATVLSENSNLTAYILPMSVLVADSNGNAVANTKVNLSVWPYAWSTGGGCTVGKTYLNEDQNENLILEPTEDGFRQEVDRLTLLPTGPINPIGPGTTDGKITAVNSAAGALPSVVTTDASGVATFDYTYTKPSALWIITRIRASTIVQGTETVAETKFRLDALDKDVTPKCLLPNSPYVY